MMLRALVNLAVSFGSQEWSLLLAAEPLGLVGDVAQAESTPWEMARWSVFTSGTAMTIVTIAIAVSALGASTSVAAIAWSRWRELELRPANYATRVLTRRLGLSKRDRRTLEALARGHGAASPGALLVCPSAFEKAAALVCGPGADDTHRAAVESLRSRLSA